MSPGGGRRDGLTALSIVMVEDSCLGSIISGWVLGALKRGVERVGALGHGSDEAPGFFRWDS